MFRTGHWRWLLVILMFAVCVAANLNGSSVGVWQKILNKPGPIRGLLFFHPKESRSDEWVHITPSMLSQACHSPPFPIQNESLGDGFSPLLMSVPVAYYTTLFRPQLWGFFLFDFEHGFAFYWWCKAFGLALAMAWLLRQLGIKQKSIVWFGTAWVYFSSFVQWWFSTPAMLPEMLACWAMMTGATLIMFQRASALRAVGAVCLFVFFGINFALCLYPGFQVPLLYVFVAVVIGCWLEQRCNPEWSSARGLTLLAVAIGTVVLLLLPFWFTIRETLRMLAATAYPGVYRNAGGGLSLFDLFSGVTGFFEAEQRTPFHYVNICEASNFYPLWPAAMLMAVVAKVRRGIALNPLISALTVVILLLSIYCIVPMPGWLARVSLLGLTTERRLLIGIGIANVLLCCIFFARYRDRILARGDLVAVGVFLLCLILGLIFARPYSNNVALSALIVFVSAALVGLFFFERLRSWFLAICGSAIALNSIAINPVMRGLSPLVESEAFLKIDGVRRQDPTARWVCYEDIRLAQLAKATGAAVLNGAQILPDMDFMHQIDPGRELEGIYNRFAYINVTLPNEPGEVTFVLDSFNFYEFTLPPEHPALVRGNYKYFIFPRQWREAELHGFGLVDQIEASNLYIYKRR
ncbi:MAG: hypothetical protein JO201_01110 [Verrucomicrobia bacterium]|nr:hypothetical protein [Verrucomicrobiota bacterium]